MKILLLSYFDPLYGPRMYLKAPEDLDTSNYHLEFIPQLMDLEELDFFIHEQNGCNSANLTFKIPQSGARGGYDFFMISLVIINEGISPKLFKHFLKDFVRELTNLKDVHLGFNVKDNDEVNLSKAEEVRQLFYTYHQDLPEETILIDRNARIILFGIEGSGKAAIVEALKNITTESVELENHITAKRLFFENLSVTTYDLPLKRSFNDLWHYYTEKADGFVYVVDISDETRFNESKNQFLSLVNNIENKKMPFLIILNKIDLKKSGIEEMVEKLDLKALNIKSIKAFPISAKNRQGIYEAFTWLANKILKRIFAKR